MHLKALDELFLFVFGMARISNRKGNELFIDGGMGELWHLIMYSVFWTFKWVKLKIQLH